MAKWLDKAVFYEIYPQSFCDSNADGIGDFNGIIEKLDYIKDLGANALWLNPCFDSPFKDAGYDVRDYKKPAARYGSENDLIRLFEEAHKRDMHVLLDLVPGHTSEEHPWFKMSQKAEKNDYSDRYIWTSFFLENGDGLNFIAGEAERNGTYIVNFFKCQPALNYGFLHPTKPWQMALTDPGPMATRDAMVDVMDYWLSRGCDGFRVDMAESLCKGDDEQKTGTIAIWQDMLGRIKTKYPESAFVSEWGRPDLSLKAGFDMDFLLNWGTDGYRSLLRDYDDFFGSEAVTKDNSYFKTDSGRSIDCFLDEYLVLYDQAKALSRRIALISGNHDMPRIARNLDQTELKTAFTFLLTMPGVPFIYYGDEIGLTYREGLPGKEGGFARTGSRTPMQWSDEPNKGFSSAASSDLYLPVEEASDAPTVESEAHDPDSLLNTVKALLDLRASESSLTDNANLVILSREPFVYQRGDLLIGINPESREKTFPLEKDPVKELLFTLGNGRFVAKSTASGISRKALIIPAKGAVIARIEG